MSGEQQEVHPKVATSIFFFWGYWRTPSLKYHVAFFFIRNSRPKERSDREWLLCSAVVKETMTKWWWHEVSSLLMQCLRSDRCCVFQDSFELIVVSLKYLLSYPSNKILSHLPTLILVMNKHERVYWCLRQYTYCTGQLSFLHVVVLMIDWNLYFEYESKN